MTTTITYKLPVYPGWRMWLWRVLRIKRPLWNVYEIADADFGEPYHTSEGTIGVDFRCNGEVKQIYKNVSGKVAGL